MRKKLLLINPIKKGQFGFSSSVISRFQPLGLGIIAALTPEDWDVEIADENVEEFRFREDVDFVGLTAFTAQVTRAYELSSLYRSKGIPTVMGGIHASMLPEEALRFADCVVVGEAENIWPRVLEDFSAGKLEKIYRGELPDLVKIPHAKRSLFHPGYVMGSLQTSRGCPMDCEFCSVTAYNGKRYRQRSVEDVLDEMESIPQSLLFIVDDNILGSGQAARERARMLFQGMINRKIGKDWFSQASLNFGDDPDMLRLAFKSGCRMVFLGIETETQEGLKETNKKTNLHIGVAQYEESFRRINKAGIAVLGSFIYMLDSDTEEALDRRTDFILNSGVDVIQTTYLTPMPGTRLYARFERENRLMFTDFPKDWDLYDFTKLTFKPLLMDPKGIHPLREKIWPKLHRRRVVFRKLLKTLWRTRSLRSAFFAFQANQSYRTIALELTNSKSLLPLTLWLRAAYVKIRHSG